MKKENKLTKFISFVLLITIIALILVAGTYAKYTSKATGSDTAVVAKWDIKATRDGNLASITGDNKTIDFDLFETVLDTDGTTETDVATGKIAPGTKGEFELQIKNDSEVNAKYTINFAITKGSSVSSAPILFSTDGGTNWTEADATTFSVSDVALNMNDTTTTEDESLSKVKVLWKWAYETKAEDDSTTAGDTVDTNVGIAANAITGTDVTAKQVKVEATLTVEQVD